MRKQLVVLVLLLTTAMMWGGIPLGYYDDANGKTGEELKSSLHDIISNGHVILTYTPGVWNAYYDTDRRADNTIWDMYSDIPDGTPEYTYTYSTDQCGNYSGEGSCYNREHSFPKSWFGNQSPMVTDIVHVVPSDGYVNGKRSNFPYGEVNSPTWTSTNGSKLGPCITDGYSGTVFEPIDEYKGDFARIYFYMATRYFGEDASWTGSDMVDGAEPKAWALEMLKRWHEADPVSDKERDRNDGIYDHQGNRNPFVDYPEYVDSVWNDDASTPEDTTVIDPSELQEITMSTSDYQLVVDYVADQGLPNTSTYDHSEYYYGASVYHTSYDIRDNKYNVSFSTPEAAIEESIIKVILPAYGSSSIVGSEFVVNYATYDGNNETGSMDFHCNSIDPLTFVPGLIASNNEIAELWSSVFIYPNPSKGAIHLSSDIDELQVISVSGQVIISKYQLIKGKSVDISTLSQGIYFANVKMGESSLMIKFIKE